MVGAAADHGDRQGAQHRAPAAHVLYRRAFHRSSTAIGPGTVWWASPSGQVLIASPARHGLGPNQAYTGLAVFTGHRYIPLPWSGRIAEAAW